MSDTPTVHQAMSGVMADIGAVGKDRRNEHFKYQFRGIDDVLNAVHAALVKHGVFYLPLVEDADYGVAGKQRVATLKVRYRFYGPAGDSVEAVTVAEGMDSGDKAPNKAMSAALKYALIQVFAIPTEDTAEPDREAPDMNGEPVRSQPPAAPPPATAAPARSPQQDAVKNIVDDLDQVQKDLLKEQWQAAGIPFDYTKLSDEQCQAIVAMVDELTKVPF